MKQIVYINMDNVMVDFPSGIAKLDEKTKQEYEGQYDEVEGIFSLMEPMPNAISAVHKLMKKYHIYALSTAPWHNPSAWSDKVKWIQHYFGEEKGSALYKRLILSHHKNLNQGEHVHFGTEQFANWNCVLSYLGCGPFTPSDILQDCLKKPAALVQVENEEQSRVIGTFADRYKWQVNLACVYADETATEYKTVYLIISPYHSNEFKLRIDAMCVDIQSEYEVLLRSKSQLQQYFQRFSDKPFLHIESYDYQPLYKAGNIFGMMARDRQIDEILEQKGA
ncbi:TPA: 5' nucleotidase, NT5C type [Haemophilus influenzae]|uniref:hypothetical protein n=1 Tax=Haemophilus influenzae TaxID=727 RepID=UPI0008DBC585|nr:hypothetical protein [Haemophilus influenzae]AOZ67839.1 hypothetical protein BG256_08750 [Haemophilus influenzae]MBD3608119.1 hypothetical protein [Haemophilus influenzae]NKB85527.1 hypothetical protein [Haemophilus influenzae]POP29516.1 hypothetical protein C3P63_03880 [Haemophilus influenzae]RDT72611.1 hypothetical protein DW287_05340 [Haemophilus influenzae]